MSLRDLLVAALVAGIAVWITETREQARFENETRLENLRFVRQVAMTPGAVGKFAGFDLQGMNLAGLNLAKADFEDANLSGANLHKTDLSGANLTNADLTQARISLTSFAEANLTATDFSNTTVDAGFSGATLHNTNFTNSKLDEVGMIDAKLINTRFINTTFSGVLFGRTRFYAVTIDNPRVGAIYPMFPDVATGDFYYSDCDNPPSALITQLFSPEMTSWCGDQEPPWPEEGSRILGPFYDVGPVD